VTGAAFGFVALALILFGLVLLIARAWMQQSAPTDYPSENGDGEEQ
jgi:hypothetical protein